MAGGDDAYDDFAVERTDEFSPEMLTLPREAPRAAARALPIRSIRASAFAVPGGEPEPTTLITVEIDCGAAVGLGYGYGGPAATALVNGLFARVLDGREGMDIPACQSAMASALRHQGRAGDAATALSAVDVALWDAKAKLLGLPLCDLIGRARDRAPVHGSGGATSLGLPALERELAAWAEAGMWLVKMRAGRHPGADVERVRAARAAIGDRVELFVDGSGGYDPHVAIAQAHRFAAAGVTLFEAPVVADDLCGLARVRDHAPPGIAIAAGAHADHPGHLARLIAAGAVDVVVADATRCGGVTGFLQAAALCDASYLPLSSHGAPSLHASLGCSAGPLRHVEWLAEHARLEQRLFDGAPRPDGGTVAPDRSRPGLGLELKRADAEIFAT